MSRVGWWYTSQFSRSTKNIFRNNNNNNDNNASNNGNIATSASIVAEREKNDVKNALRKSKLRQPSTSFIKGNQHDDSSMNHQVVGNTTSNANIDDVPNHIKSRIPKDPAFTSTVYQS